MNDLVTIHLTSLILVNNYSLKWAKNVRWIADPKELLSIHATFIALTHAHRLILITANQGSCIVKSARYAQKRKKEDKEDDLKCKVKVSKSDRIYVKRRSENQAKENTREVSNKTLRTSRIISCSQPLNPAR